MSKPTIIAVGLKFRSIHFRAHAEISAIRKDKNQLDVILTSNDGSWEEKGWNLQHTERAFEKGEYFVPPTEPEISVY